MLRRFKLINAETPEQNKFAILEYDTESDKYALHIPKDINPEWLPAIPYGLYEKGVYDVDDYWARRFVKERVIPPERQNIGSILRTIGAPYYTEFAILEYCGGRCCMDEFYLEEIKGPL